MKIKKKIICFFLIIAVFYIVLFSHSYFVIAIIVFSLVDKRAGFSNPEVVGSNPGSVIFFLLFS